MRKYRSFASLASFVVTIITGVSCFVRLDQLVLKTVQTKQLVNLHVKQQTD